MLTIASVLLFASASVVASEDCFFQHGLTSASGILAAVRKHISAQRSTYVNPLNCLTLKFRIFLISFVFS